jgi:hypothetical protein
LKNVAHFISIQETSRAITDFSQAINSKWSHVREEVQVMPSSASFGRMRLAIDCLIDYYCGYVTVYYYYCIEMSRRKRNFMSKA